MLRMRTAVVVTIIIVSVVSPSSSSSSTRVIAATPTKQRRSCFQTVIKPTTTTRRRQSKSTSKSKESSRTSLLLIPSPIPSSSSTTETELRNQQHPNSRNKFSHNKPLHLTTTTTLTQPTNTLTKSLFDKLDILYSQSSTNIRCPFFRRRIADLIDSVAIITKFLLVRHKSLNVFDPFFVVEEGDENNHYRRADNNDNEEEEAMMMMAVVPPGCKAIGRHVRHNVDGSVRKSRGMSVEDLARVVEKDWVVGADGCKGYYLTGKLDSTIYRDDCLFDGPDPDMPVRGLRKYLSAASHLFDANQSEARLLSISHDPNGGYTQNGSIMVTWRLSGVLMLPWKPKMKPWTGSTVYHLDESGLIYLHEEFWDVSVWEAFVCTVWPDLGGKIWGEVTL